MRQNLFLNGKNPHAAAHYHPPPGAYKDRPIRFRRERLPDASKALNLDATIKNISRLTLNTVSIWNGGNASSMGAAVAYYTIFAIAPMFILVLALAGFIFGQEAAQRELFGQISSLVGKQGGEAVQSLLTAANKPGANTLATIGALITLFIGATGVFSQLQNSLNAIWNVRPKPGNGLRNFVRNRLLSFAMLLGIGFLLLVSLVLSAALAAAGKYMSGIIPAQETLWQIADFIISLGLITLLFAMIFKILPDVKIVWRDVWFGTVWHGGAGGCALAGVVINSSFGQGCQNAAAPILSDHFKNCTGG